MFTPYLQFVINQLQQLNIGKKEFQYLFFLLFYSTATNISSLNLRWIEKKKKKSKCDQMILQLKLYYLTKKGGH